MDMLMIFAILRNEQPLPDIYYIGKDCVHNHGIKGKTIRYIASRNCLICGKKANTNANSEKLKKESGLRTKALRAFEKAQDKEEDYWDL